MYRHQAYDMLGRNMMMRNSFLREKSLMKIKHLIWGAVFALLVSPVFSQSADAGRVIASTSWVAAIARAAGATDIVTIAPFDLQHPPEHELKPSDLMKVSGAKFLVYSGYERFAKRLAETADTDGNTVAKVYTDNIPSTLINCS